MNYIMELGYSCIHSYRLAIYGYVLRIQNCILKFMSFFFGDTKFIKENRFDFCQANCVAKCNYTDSNWNKYLS